MLSFLDGLAGGAIGGIAQGLFAMLITALTGAGFFWPLALIGHMFRPYTDAPHDDPATITRGALIHMVLTPVLGLVFVLIVLIVPLGPPLWLWGMAYGVLIWLVGRLGVLRAIDPTMAEHMNMLLFFASHLVYGGVLGWWLQALPIDL